ncbi:GntR family transcriptional regulator [Streptomyces syringium]|uniref:GntR family transcriptional regulator n=1 Tax=Streptomyces syringium TaxID=76729 RepID=UPI003412BD38
MVRVITVQGIPAYLQVAGAIGDRIASGEFERGSRLPTRVSFAGHYRVSETVVHSAMTALERQGLVRRDAHSTALYVTEGKPCPGQADLAPILQRLNAVEAQVEQLRNGPASAARADQTQVPGSGTWHRTSLRGVSVLVLREVSSVLARLGRRSGRAHRRAA